MLALEAGGGGGGSPLSAWPVGSVYIAVDSVSPATKFGGGVWLLTGQGRCLVGQDATQPEFAMLEATGGEKAHALTVAELPAHSHAQDAHTHGQDPHAHGLTDPGHTHIQDPHQHGMNEGTVEGAGNFADRSSASAPAAIVTDPATATNQAATTGASVNAATATTQAATATNQNTGGGAAHNNLQPYLVVNIWKRVA